MKSLAGNDRKYLEAAEGWWELGNCPEADKELEGISPEMRAHPEVLNVRWQIYAKSGDWDAALEIANALVTQRPDRTKSWVRKAQALKHLTRLDEARHSIGNAREARNWPVDDLFELAFEAADLGDKKEALLCLKAAAGKPGFAQMKALALVTGAFAEIHPQIKALG